MIHIQQPPVTAPTSHDRPQRRRIDLTLPLPSPQRCTTSTTHHFIPYSELLLLDRIGSGCSGTVYKALHRTTGHVYALKVIYGHHDDSVRRQIRREIQILQDVDDPNVVKCHDMYDHNCEIRILLEFMDGGSFEGKHITDDQHLADLAGQVLRGLAYLHRRRIVHGEIKPSNLLINSHKQVKIADFGVGRILNQTMDPCKSSAGTIAYTSPERINTDINDGLYDAHAGDIWSLGVCILEFYMGRFPFAEGRRGDWASLMCAICMSEPPEAPPTASMGLRHFVSCCLQRDPSRRWTASRLLRHPFIAVSIPHRIQPRKKSRTKATTLLETTSKHFRQMVEEFNGVRQNSRGDLVPFISHCRLFPFGYEFAKDELVSLWVAEGLFQIGTTQEIAGNQMFDLLVSKEIVIPSRTDQSVDFFHHKTR